MAYQALVPDERPGVPGSVGEALVRARTTPPRPSPRTFPRPRLLQRLELGVAGPVTLVVGGPGTGKTQLVSQWVQQRTAAGPAAWLALAPDCDDPQLLWSLLLTALRQASPTSEGLHALRAPADVDEAFLGHVVQELDALPGPIVLVLEDVHEVRSPVALAGLDHLIGTMPAQLRLVLVSRALPDLALHGRRVAGELTDIGGQALAFTAPEAAELFSQHDLPLTPQEIARLLARTEGWAAGLRLAALTLQDRSDPLGRAQAIARFAGDERTVADYLVGEVLDRQPPELRRFLLLTSVAERIDASLADALTGTSGGAQSLDSLARAGALVIALDDARGWYRYHRLLLETCRHRLAVEEPEQVPVLHSRAARWFASRDEPIEAIRHCLAGADWPLLGQIVLLQAGDMVFGHQGRAVRELLRQLPADAAPDDAWLACARALAWHDEADRTQLQRMLGRAGRLVATLDEPERQLPELVLNLLRSADRRAHYDVAGAATYSARALELADRTATPATALPRYSAYGHLLLGKSLVWQGRLAEAESHLRQAVALPPPGRPDANLAVLGRAYLSLVLAMQGSLGQAQHHAVEALDLAARAGWADDVQSTSAHLALVLVHQQRADRAGWERALSGAARILERRPDRLLDIAHRLAAVRLAVDDGALDLAQVALAEATALVAALPGIHFLAGWLDLVQAEVDLAAGRHEKVLVATGPAAAGADAAYPRVLRARALLAAGRPQEAIDCVAPVTGSTPEGIRAVEAWLVTAEALHAARLDAAALVALGSALDAAAAEQLLRPFTRSAAWLRPLLERHQLVAATHSRMVARILETNAGAAGPPNPLTDRELSVLMLLPTLMSNTEIAAELFVSVNTVKAHLKSIYRKLGVTGRREAVLRGHRHGLLERLPSGNPRSRPPAGPDSDPARSRVLTRDLDLTHSG